MSGIATVEETARILVADDAPQNVALIQALLTLAGYDVLTASEGEEALHKVRDDSPDLVLLDVMMPKLSGYDTCAQLKGNERTRLTPVILITPTDDPDDNLRAIEVGADDLLHRPLNRIQLLARIRSLVREKRLNDELISMDNAIIALGRAVEVKDAYTEQHMKRVATYALNLGGEMGSSQRDQQLLWKASILHDVGKIGIRESILFKKEPLTGKELEHIKTHPIWGARICQPLQVDPILDLIRHHHERWDGRGYPDGLAGEDIPVGARIIAIADTYDAITSDRPYRGRQGRQRALQILRSEAGKQFDPTLVATFTNMIERSD